MRESEGKTTGSLTLTYCSNLRSNKSKRQIGENADRRSQTSRHKFITGVESTIFSTFIYSSIVHSLSVQYSTHVIKSRWYGFYSRRPNNNRSTPLQFANTLCVFNRKFVFCSTRPFNIDSGLNRIESESICT